jgi:hypothetical protein
LQQIPLLLRWILFRAIVLPRQITAQGIQLFSIYRSRRFFLPLFSAGTRVSRSPLLRAAVCSCSQLTVPWFLCVWVKAAARDSPSLTPLALSFSAATRDRFSLFMTFSSSVFFVVVDLVAQLCSVK